MIKGTWSVRPEEENGKGRQERGLAVQEEMSQGRGIGEFQEKTGQPLVWDGKKRFLLGQRDGHEVPSNCMILLFFQWAEPRTGEEEESRVGRALQNLQAIPTLFPPK